LGLPEYLTAELANLQSQVLETNSSTHIEIKLPKPDGSVRYFELILNPLFDEVGNIVGIGGAGRNINRRKEAENALRQLNEDLEARVLERNAEILKSNEALKTAEEKYRTVSDFAFNWEYWVDQNDRMIYCSPACERVTGFKPTEFEQNPELIYAMSYPEDSLILRDHKMKELQGSVCDHEVQYRIIRKDGIIRWIGHFCRPVFDDSGIFKGTRGSNKDITARKKMEELLTTSNNKYRLLSENITDGIFICRNGMFEYANKAIYDIFGYQGRELEKIKLTQLVMTDYHEDLETFLYAMGPVDQSRSFEVECLRKDLSQVFVEIILRYVAKDSMIYGVAHDITEKKMLQKNTMKTIIQTEEKERSRFSKELHDGLGPLLSTIKLYLKWSERHSRNKAHKEIIEKAGEIVEEALVTVKEISNKLNPMILTNFGLEEAVSSFVQKLKETSRLNIFFDSNMKKRMDIETEATLYRVIIECINNTLKYARAKNIGITIKEDESQINVRYRDDGIGFNINEMLLNHQGLGLNNIMNRLQNIGGKAELKSEAGKGVDYLFVVKMGG